MTPHDAAQRSENQSEALKEFPGFQPLTGNFLYCPNQFFDVCLPHYSRGVLRLVAFVLRKTLGWLDKNGNPIEQNVSISYADLIAHARVSRGAARKAIEEAIAGGFIRRTRLGRPGSRGVTAETSTFELRFDDGPSYIKDPKAFQGFFARCGHRTPIPNAFFDRIIPEETLAVTKVVGTVLRHTVGYQNQFGGRRSEAPLSYSYIQRYSNLLHRPTLAEALRQAIKQGYVLPVSQGHFDPDAGRKSRAAKYAVKWLTEATSKARSSKTEPTPKQSKNRTGSGSKYEPAEQFKNRTDRKTRVEDTSKQQPAAFKILCDVGFDERVAKHLSETKPLSDIEKQIAWIDKREPSTNRLGMLRRAIEEDWAAPASVLVREKELARSRKQKECEAREIAEEKQREERFRARRAKWLALRPEVQAELRQAAIENAHPKTRAWLERQPADRPVADFLSEMEKATLDAN